jgi:hypothetical protein
MNKYVVTTSIRGHSRTLIWDTTSPLTLGHPFRWLIEKTEEGIRVREVTQKLGEIEKLFIEEATDDSIHKSGAKFKIDDLSIHVKSTRSLAPAFDCQKGNLINAYTCIGNWILTSEKMRGSFTGYYQKHSAFMIKKSGEGYQIKITANDVNVDDKAFKKGDILNLTSDKLTQSTLSMGSYSWRFSYSEAQAIPAGEHNVKNTEDDKSFIASMGMASAVLLLFVITSAIWPKPEPTELVPPQFTQIVMNKIPRPAQAQPEPAPAAAQAKAEVPEAVKTAPEKVQKAAVVQAFRAKALTNAVSNLMKGGMTSLLAQSDFVAGKKTDDAKNLFNSKSNALKAQTGSSGLTDKKITVASMGGAAGSKGVGYSNGTHASVNGQGKGFVSMDIGGGRVEEGLTKDEVGEVIHRHLSEIRYCYESSMIRMPDIEGKLVVNFTIAGNGIVKISEIKTSTLPDPRLDDCILRRLVTWKFPNTKGGIDVAVTYPFLFKTLGR